MNLNNFLITQNGKVVMIDWEYHEMGDALKDVGLAYHNILLTFSIKNVNEGIKLGNYFLRQYIKNSSIKIHNSTLNFYLVATALQEFLFYNARSTNALNPHYVLQTFGRKYVFLFPLIWIYFRLKTRILERFIAQSIGY